MAEITDIIALNGMSRESRYLKQTEVLSPLMRAKATNAKGQIVNGCPYKCNTEDLDENGYCRHLVGFTDKDDPKFKGDSPTGLMMEPMALVEGKRVVRPFMEKIYYDDPATGRNEWKWGKPQLEPVLKSDHLERVTTSWRVYRNIDEHEAPRVGLAEKRPPAKPKIDMAELMGYFGTHMQALTADKEWSKKPYEERVEKARELARADYEWLHPEVTSRPEPKPEA